MIFYIGNKVEVSLTKKVIEQRNRVKFWDYGYCEEIDVIIISKDGTLGEIYEIQGIRVGLPEIPKDKSQIINSDKPKFAQKWKREEMPRGLEEETMSESRFSSYIDDQFKKRLEGVWINIKGTPVYMTGTYWFGIQWYREEVDYPMFRVIQNELMIFWEACKADSRSFGMQYVKNRRIGASMLAIIELIESGTIYEDKLLGIVSKKGKDSSKIFRRLIKGFKRLPCFFQPQWDGTNTPKTELVLDEPTKRRKAGEKVSEEQGLGTSISWHNTEINAMDGDAIFRSLLDESAKYPKEVPFSEYWYIVKTSHTRGIRITGKSMVVSTVNPMKKGGSEYRSVWNDSDPLKRDANGRTISGLYQLFIPAKYCLEGMFDEFGFTIMENPDKPIKTDEGVMTSIGSIAWLENTAETLKADPEKYNEHKRQFPDTIKDAFRDDSSDCAFNLVKIQENIDHNEHELDDKYDNSGEFQGNTELERGNLQWENGKQDTKVIWVPDLENGRFFVRKGCFPLKEFQNAYEMKMAFGVMGKSPLAGHIGTGGVDPYNRSRTADGRGSKGSYHLTTKTHTYDEYPNESCIVEYIARPRTVQLFFEDMIMVSVFWSVPFLSELSNEQFLTTVKDRGYRHYSMNNPFKPVNKLSPTELELGGAPQQDSKIGEAQFYATESFVENHLGVARDSRHRMQGEMGDFPFSRTLYQIKDVDVEKRTKFDAYISFSLSRIGNQRRIFKAPEKKQRTIMPFQKYDNSGYTSKSL